MHCEIIVGATRTGKTTLVKSMLDAVPNKRSIFVYDVNAEYGEYYPYDFIEYETFTEKVTKVKNSVIVLEESTIFLSNKSCNQKITELLVRKRHTNNYVILCFHSLRSIPRNVYDLANYITVFKTNDSAKLVQQKFEDERLTQLVEKAKLSKNEHFKEKLQIY